MGNVQQHIGKRTTIGRYEVEVVKYLGEGGSSFIFLVKDVASSTAAPMVLKRLLAENDAKLAWIQSEIRTHQRFRHPQIVEFYASQTNRTKGSEREVFILMEYCPAGHLHDNMTKMGEKRFSERELLRVFRQLCVPVNLLHHEDPPIAHRDLKLENFLLAKNGVYKLCDFGSCVDGPQRLATKADRAREMENVDKRTTAMYRSPELADVEGTAMFGAGELTEAVDVWAMGCVLYTMAFFKPPFPPDGLRTERYAIPDSSKYSGHVHALIKRMLTADVELRATIDHVMECIDEIMDGRPIPPLRRAGAATSDTKTPATATTTSASEGKASSSAPTKKAEARKETLPVAKPAMDLLDMDFNPSIATKAPASADVWNAAPGSTGEGAAGGFANFASFPPPPAWGTGGGAKRMDAFGFPASPEKPQQQPAAPPTAGFVAPIPTAMPTAAPVDPFAALAPAMGAGHGAPRMGGGAAAVPGFTGGFHAQSPAQQQFYGQQPLGFYPPAAQPQQQQAQGFYHPQPPPQQPQHQQMWGAHHPQQQHQQPAFGGASNFNGNRF